jgi:hypothetical protein
MGTEGTGLGRVGTVTENQGRERFIAGEFSLFDRYAIFREDSGNLAAGGKHPSE